MRFEVLGPLAVHDDMGVELAVPRAKARTVLGLLLCAPNTPIPSSRLVDALWPDDPSESAVRNLHVYVHQLRKALGAGRIESSRYGYLVHAAEDELDIARFTALHEQAETAKRCGDTRRAATLLRSALHLWRGEPFTGCDPSPVLEAQATRWGETRLAAWQRCVDLELALGRHRELLPELTEVVHTYPLSEAFRAQLMLALYRCGRITEALDTFTEARKLIIDETGLEPGTQLRTLQQAVLREDPDIEAPESDGPRHSGPPVARPAQLPAAIGDFTGRGKQVDQLCALLADEAVETPVVVSAIAGRGGVGKTTLAVHAAHRLASTFDGGQLYVNLRGAEAEPLPPGEVLGRFLRALGIDGASIPDDTAERAALYRTHLNERRVLVVLDNAANEQQVRPLLPGGRSSGVLITSRARLTSLEGAQRLDLDALAPDQATELLARVAGPDRVAADPEAAETIVRLCGCLPLALRVAGARLDAHPDWSLARFAARLSDERHRLDELTEGDLEVRGSLSLSYAGIPSPARRALRLLGVAGLPEFAAWILCPLLEIDRYTAESLAEELVRAQLLDALGEDATGQLRYRLHDLVRVYAFERAEVEDRQDERCAALRRLDGAWLALANHGADALRSGLPRPRHGIAPQWELDPELVSALLAEPLAWFESEAPALVAAVGLADRLDLDETAWELFSALVAGRYMLGSQFDEWWRAYRAAHAVVRRAGNAHGEAIVESGIGLMYFRQDRFTDAVERFGGAAATFAEHGSAHEEAIARTGLGICLACMGRADQALEHVRYAHATFDDEDDQHAAACACEVLGAVQTARGATAEALDALHRALDGYRVWGDPRGEANTSDRIGRAYVVAGEYADAVEWLQQAREMFLGLADRAGHAETTHDLAIALFRQGKRADAERALRQCLDAYRKLGRHGSVARVLSTVGEISLHGGDLDKAAEYLDRAQAIWSEQDQPLWRARNLLVIGDVHTAHGNADAARDAWTRSRDLFAEIGSPEADRATTRLRRSVAEEDG